MDDIVAPQQPPEISLPNNQQPVERGGNKKNIEALFKKLQKTQRDFSKNAKIRQEEQNSILRDVQKTGFTLLAVILFIAGVADLLSIADLGWLISWLIPLTSWIMVRRINAIRKVPQKISGVAERLYRQQDIVRQRLTPLLRPQEQALLATYLRRDEILTNTKSYVTTFIRDTIIVQLVELIPGVDAVLPMYLAGVVKLILNQNAEYQKAQLVIAPYQKLLDTVTSLERLEIEKLSQQLTLLIYGQQAAIPVVTQPRPTTPTPTTPSTIKKPGTDILALAPL